MIGQYPYPVEAMRHCYVTVVGGSSQELKPGEIGVNYYALAENTDLVPYRDRVIVSKLDGIKVQPLYHKKYFTVVPVDVNKPDAYSKSRLGQVVFPENGTVFSDQIVTGDQVILNSVFSGNHRNALAATIDSLIKNNSDGHYLECRKEHG